MVFSHRISKALPALAFFLAASSAHAQVAAIDPARHADLADQIIAEFGTRQDINKYTKVDGTSMTLVAGIGGVTQSFNHSVCAPFVTNLVKLANGMTGTDFKAALATPLSSPDSSEYYDLIVRGKVDGKGFNRVVRALDIRRGDVVAMTYEACGASSGGSGHTMIAMSAPRLRVSTGAKVGGVSNTMVPGTVQYEIDVADSSSSPHGTVTNNVVFNDTRNTFVEQTDSRGRKKWVELEDPKDSTDVNERSGAGRGILRIYADEVTGEIRGYTWSVSTGSDYYATDSCRRIAVGRF
ncbi:MAG TPA: hypothetical protein VIT92_05765 [Burkholderiaceae bacterium]